MTDFAFWQYQANQAGLVMCAICYESVPPEDLWRDSDGNLWDMCRPCGVIEERYKND